MKEQNLNKPIIANPNIFEIGKQSYFAKQIIKNSNGARIGTKGFKKKREVETNEKNF